MAGRLVFEFYNRLCAVFNRALSFMRAVHFRMKGIKIGKSCYIGPGVQIVGNVVIGNHSVIGEYTYIGTMKNGHIVIGADCHIGSLCSIGASEQVTIGDHFICASYVQITDASHGMEDKDVLIKHAPIITSPVKIGKDVWLGSGVLVLKGVTIGDGTVIGGKSLVNESIHAYSIAVGVPAKVIRVRGG